MQVFQVVKNEVLGIGLIATAILVGRLYQNLADLREWQKEHERTAVDQSDIRILTRALHDLTRKLEVLDKRIREFDARVDDKLRVQKQDLREEFQEIRGRAFFKGANS